MMSDDVQSEYPDEWWHAPGAAGCLVSYMEHVPSDRHRPNGYVLEKRYGIFVEHVMRRVPEMPEPRIVPRLVVLIKGKLVELERWRVLPER